MTITNRPRTNHFAKIATLLPANAQPDDAPTISSLLYLRAVVQSQLEDCASYESISVPEDVIVNLADVLSAETFEYLQDECNYRLGLWVEQQYCDEPDPSLTAQERNNLSH